MPWSYPDNVPKFLKNKSKEAIKVGIEAGNAALTNGQTEEEAVFAAQAAASNWEKKHSVKKMFQPKVEKEQPWHVKAMIAAVEKRKQELASQEQLKKQLQLEEEQRLQQQILDKVKETLKETTADAIVDMQVQGDNVLLIHKDGRRVKRKLADYVVNQSVTVSAPEPRFTNLNPSIAVGGIPAGSSFEGVPVTEMFDQLLYPFTIALAASPNLVEIGTILNSINLVWNSSIDNASFALNQGIGDVTGTTSYEYTEPVTSNITFTLTAVSGGMTRMSNAGVSFKNRVITAATSSLLPDEAELLAAGGVLSDSFNRSATYDCTGGKRPYIAYPTRLGVLTGATVNNLTWNDYSTTTVSHTNSSGYTEDYYVIVSNNILYGSSVTIKWGA